MRTNWIVWFDDKDMEIHDKIEDVRRAKGMTKKGFILYAIANMIPELAPDILDYLMKRPRSRIAKSIREDIEDVANAD